MSRTLAPFVTADGDTLRRLTRQMDQTLEAAARLSGSHVAPGDLYLGLLQKSLAGIEAPAGAVWLRTPQGFLQLQCQINLAKVGLDDRPDGKQSNKELLRQAFQINQLAVLEPGASLVTVDGVEVGNRTSYPVVLVPILVEERHSIGLFQVWLDPTADPRLRSAFVNFIIQMTGYASNYVRNSSSRRGSLQEQVYVQLEAYSQQIHSSLNPTEVAFHVANEGRRIVGCDRICVGVRHGKSARIEAISGADVVETSSTQVKRMRALFDAVLNWNEKLVHRGTRDETLPPKVLAALEAYLAENSPKLLVLQPLRDPREKREDQEKEVTFGPARSALLLESYEPPEPPEPMLERFEVISGHAASALYNASEVKRIPLRFLWRPLAALQNKAGGKRRFYFLAAAAVLTAMILALVLVPYPLKLDAKGQLLPVDRNYIYPTGTGRVVQFKVNPGDIVRPRMAIAVMHDLDLAKEISDKLKEVQTAESEEKTLSSQTTVGNAAEKKKKSDDWESKKMELKSLHQQMQTLLDIHHADPNRPGMFTVLAPEFRPGANTRGKPQYKVISSDYQEQLTNKWVRPTDPLLRVGNTSGAWTIEQKIPQKHISQVRQAFQSDDPNEYLEVDVLVTSAPTQTYRGRLYQRDIGAEARENKDEHDQSEPVVYAYVRVNEDDMPAEDHIPTALLVTGVEVHTKIRAGNRSLGYCLFYGVWEFLYEKVVFAF